MKTKYNMGENYFNYYNEAQGIVLKKWRYKRNKSKKITTYMRQGFFYSLCLIGVFLFLFFLLSLMFDFISTEIWLSTVWFVLFIIVFYYLLFFLEYAVSNRRNHIGEFEIDEYGITDSSENFKCSIPWKRIKMIVFGKWTITFVTNAIVVFFIPIENKKKVKNALAKYAGDLVIVESRESNK